MMASDLEQRRLRIHQLNFGIPVAVIFDFLNEILFTISNALLEVEVREASFINLEIHRRFIPGLLRDSQERFIGLHRKCFNTLRYSFANNSI